METLEVAKLFQDNIDKVLTPSRYKNIIRMDNNLNRFNIINRILIEIQCPNAYDVRTADEWLIDNRSIKSGSKGINIMLPVCNYKYIDTETGNEINTNDLTLNELNAAVKHGVIRREDAIETYCIKKMYDIRQTISLGNSKYEVSKPEIKTSSLINIFQRITGCTITNGDITYYSKSKNELTISKQKYSELASTLVDALVDSYVKTFINRNYSSDEFSEYDIDLIRYTLKYSLDTLLRNYRDCEFDIVRYTNNDKILLILNIVDSAIYSVSENMKYKDTYINKDIASNLETLRKAEIILNIMEANNISRIMKGI